VPTGAPSDFCCGDTKQRPLPSQVVHDASALGLKWSFRALPPFH